MSSGRRALAILGFAISLTISITIPTLGYYVPFMRPSMTAVFSPAGDPVTSSGGNASTITTTITNAYCVGTTVSVEVTLSDLDWEGDPGPYKDVLNITGWPPSAWSSCIPSGALTQNIDGYYVGTCELTLDQPGTYSFTLLGNNQNYIYAYDPGAFEWTVEVVAVEPDIDNDADNNGVIESADDVVEELYPGNIIQTGNLVRTNLSYLPSGLDGWQLRLQASNSSIEVYADEAGTTKITLPNTYTIGQGSIPDHVYVKGVQAGSASLAWVFLGPRGEVCRDTVVFSVSDSPQEQGLPHDHLNNAAGADRRNIRWSNPDTSIAYADDFTLPSGNWTINRIRMWTVPPVPVSPAYALGDHYSSIALYTGTPAGDLSPLVSGSLSEGSSSTSNIVCTPVTYFGAADYQLPDGTSNKIWQVDFTNLNWAVSGGTTYRCGMVGIPRHDRLWFSHATHSNGAANSFVPFMYSTGEMDTYVTGEEWFDKGSDLNIQLFCSPR